MHHHVGRRKRGGAHACWKRRRRAFFFFFRHLRQGTLSPLQRTGRSSAVGRWERPELGIPSFPSKLRCCFSFSWKGKKEGRKGRNPISDLASSLHEEERETGRMTAERQLSRKDGRRAVFHFLCCRSSPRGETDTVGQFLLARTNNSTRHNSSWPARVSAQGWKRDFSPFSQLEVILSNFRRWTDISVLNFDQEPGNWRARETDL